MRKASMVPLVPFPVRAAPSDQPVLPANARMELAVIPSTANAIVFLDGLALNARLPVQTILMDQTAPLSAVVKMEANATAKQVFVLVREDGLVLIVLHSVLLECTVTPVKNSAIATEPAVSRRLENVSVQLERLEVTVTKIASLVTLGLDAGRHAETALWTNILQSVQQTPATVKNVLLERLENSVKRYVPLGSTGLDVSTIANAQTATNVIL